MPATGAQAYLGFANEPTFKLEVVGENVGTGDGTTTEFTLANAPVMELTETVYLDGTAQTRDTDYTINYTTGAITFSTAPASGVAITADYQYRPSALTLVPFGVSQRVTSKTPRNNVERIFDLGSRAAVKTRALRFEGALSVEALLANEEIFEALLGSKSGAGTSGDPYVFSKSNAVKTIAVTGGFDTTSDVSNDLVGGIITRVRMATRINEFARITVDVFYASEYVADAVETGVLESNAPFTFVEGSVEFPSGTVVAKVQSAEISIGTNNEAIFALNSREAVDKFARQLDVEMRITAVAESTDLLKYAMGGDTSKRKPQDTIAENTLKFIFSDSEKTMTITVTGAVINEISYAIAPNELILYDITYTAKDVQIEYYE